MAAPGSLMTVSISNRGMDRFLPSGLIVRGCSCQSRAGLVHVLMVLLGRVCRRGIPGIICVQVHKSGTCKEQDGCKYQECTHNQRSVCHPVTCFVGAVRKNFPADQNGGSDPARAWVCIAEPVKKIIQPDHPDIMRSGCLRGKEDEVFSPGTCSLPRGEDLFPGDRGRDGQNRLLQLVATVSTSENQLFQWIIPFCVVRHEEIVTGCNSP